MLAIKANRVYKITEDEKQKYIDLGYKIAELKDDKLVFEEIATEESKEIAKLEDENKKLKTKIKKLELEINKAKKGEGK